MSMSRKPAFQLIVQTYPNAARGRLPARQLPQVTEAGWSAQADMSPTAELHSISARGVGTSSGGRRPPPRAGAADGVARFGSRRP